MAYIVKVFCFCFLFYSRQQYYMWAQSHGMGLKPNQKVVVGYFYDIFAIIASVYGL